MDKWKQEKCVFDINQLNAEGQTALVMTCCRGFDVASMSDEAAASDTNLQSRSACIQILLKHGADKDIQAEKTGMTPLHWTAFHGDIKSS